MLDSSTSVVWVPNSHSQKSPSDVGGWGQRRMCVQPQGAVTQVCWRIKPKMKVLESLCKCHCLFYLLLHSGACCLHLSLACAWGMCCLCYTFPVLFRNKGWMYLLCKALASKTLYPLAPSTAVSGLTGANNTACNSNSIQCLNICRLTVWIGILCQNYLGSMKNSWNKHANAGPALQLGRVSVVLWQLNWGSAPPRCLH